MDLRSSYAETAGTLNQDHVPEIVTELLDVQNQSELLGRVLKLNRATVDAIFMQFSDPKKTPPSCY